MSCVSCFDVENSVRMTATRAFAIRMWFCYALWRLTDAQRENRECLGQLELSMGFKVAE